MRDNWIWLQNSKQADSYVEFIDKFDYSQGKTTLKISCDSNYALFVNEQLVGFSQYSDYPWHKFSNLHNLEKYLKQGENDIRIIVWYYGDHNFSYYVGEPCLNYQISIDEKIVAESSENTLCRKAVGYEWGRKKMITGQLGFTFKYDCRDFGQEYHKAVKVKAPCENVYLRPIENLVLSPKKSAKKIKSEYQIYDLGRESVGLLYIDFKADAGVTITVSYGEHLRDGRVARIIHTRDFSAEIVANGQRVEYFNPFRRFGGRYLEVTADGEFEIYDIGIRETDYPFDEKPFETKDQLRKLIYDTSVRTLELCFHEHYEDCPWREQGLYGLDSRHQMLFGYHAFNGFACQRASLELFCLDIREDGLIPICSPTSHPQPPIPSFTLFFIVAMAEYIQYSGDTSLAEKYYSQLEKSISSFIKRIDGGLYLLERDGSCWNFYEWADNLWGDPKLNYSTDCVVNCILSLTLNKFAYICSKLNKDATKYENLSNDLNKAIYKTFYDNDKKVFKLFTDGVYAESASTLAILCGAVSGEDAKEVAEKLADGQMQIKATLSMKAFKYDALLKVDKQKYKQIILQDIDKTYKKMLDKDATSFWETELGAEDFEGAGSLCHGWSAMPVYYYNILGENQKESTKC